MPILDYIKRIIVILTFLSFPTIINRPVHAANLDPQVDPPPSPDWVAWEEEIIIKRRQYPDKYPDPLLLPDLRTLPPSDFRLVFNRSDEQKLLRFSNTIWNRGPGVLELRGVYKRENKTILVSQNIYREDGDLLKHQAGEFGFHPAHGHWHWEDFSQYKVWSIRPDGSLEHVLAANDKVGYCLRDIAPYEGADYLAETSARAGYSSCYWARQGLSVGWLDTYKARMPGQSVDITNLPEGIYALKSTVDPQNLIREAEESNNSAVIYFSIHQNGITVLGSHLSPIQPRPEFR